MYELASPLARVRLPRDEDCVFFYRCNEATSANFVDAGPDGWDLTDSGGTGSAALADLVNGQTNAQDATRGSRDFGATPGEGSATGDTGIRSDFRDGPLTVCAVIKPDTAIAALGTVLNVGGIGSGGSSANRLFRAQHSSAGVMEAHWQHSANTNVTASSGLAALANGGRYWLVWVRETDPDNTGRVRVRFYRGDLDARTLTSATVANLVPPDNGPSSPTIRLGFTTAGGAGSFEGAMQDVGAMRFAASEAWVYEQFRRMLRTYDEETMWRSQSFTCYVRAFLEDANGDMQNVDDVEGVPDGVSFLKGVAGDDDVDNVSEPFTLTLDRQVGLFNLSPFFGGPLNEPGPFLDVMRQVRVEIAPVPYGIEFADLEDWHWRTWREGWTSKIKMGTGEDEPIVVECFDKMHELNRCYVVTQNTYGDDDVGSAPVLVEVLQSMVDDNAANFKTGTAYEVWDRDTCLWASAAFTLEHQHLGPAMVQKAMDPGFDLRFCWDPIRCEYRLTLLEPERSNTTPELTIAEDEAFGLRAFEIDEAYIVNDAAVDYVPRHDGTPVGGDFEVATATSDDATSIARYGKRSAKIVEATAPHDATTAQALADALVSDNSVPTSPVGPEVPFCWFLGLRSVFDLGPNEETHDEALTVAMTGHSWEVSEGCTSIFRVRIGVPVGRYKTWAGRLVYPGGQNDRPDDNPVSLEIDDVAVLAPGLMHVALAGWPGLSSLDANFDRTELHYGTTGFTVGDASLAPGAVARATGGVIPAVTPGVAYAARAVPVDRRGNRGTPSAEVAFQAWYTVPNLAPRGRIFVVSDNAKTYGTSPEQVRPGTNLGSGPGSITTDYEVGNIISDDLDFEMVAEAPGLYRIAWNILLGSAAVEIQTFLYVDTGSGFAHVADGQAAAAAMGLCSSSYVDEVELDEGDVVAVYVDCQTGGARIQPDTWMSMRLVQQTGDVA